MCIICVHYHDVNRIPAWPVETAQPSATIGRFADTDISIDITIRCESAGVIEKHNFSSSRLRRVARFKKQMTCPGCTQPSLCDAVNFLIYKDKEIYIVLPFPTSLPHKWEGIVLLLYLLYFISLAPCHNLYLRTVFPSRLDLGQVKNESLSTNVICT